ncbi:MAG: tetratricopeptide repeat protein [Helicobacteraceae bacterium]|nr:tetratricopeptide repeat protein [Helicobacteraceae bacterium]
MNHKKQSLAALFSALVLSGCAATSPTTTSDNAKSAFDQGVVAYEQGNLQEAIKHFTQAITIDPNCDRHCDRHVVFATTSNWVVFLTGSSFQITHVLRR